jgi:TPR repeat protein
MPFGFAEPGPEHSRLFQDARGGDIEAQYTLAHLYLKGRGGVVQDTATAIGWFEKAATRGHQDAPFDLALLYMEGIRVEKSSVLALEWLEKAAAAGNPYGQYYLGLAYLENEPDVARIWLEKSAGAGNSEAQEKIEALCLNDKRWCE